MKPVFIFSYKNTEILSYLCDEWIVNPKYWSFPLHSLLLFNLFKTGPLGCVEQTKQRKCKKLAEPSDAIRMLFFDVVNIPVCLTGLWHFDFFFIYWKSCGILRQIRLSHLCFFFFLTFWLSNIFWVKFFLLGGVISWLPSMAFSNPLYTGVHAFLSGCPSPIHF